MLVFDWLTAEEVQDAFKIEQLGYPSDEAATLQTLQYRQSVASDLFLGVYVASAEARELIGFICSTLSPASSLTHESMSQHVPLAPSVCIHSVCVSPSHRRQGVGLELLKDYLQRLERRRAEGVAAYERVLLIAHEELRTFYEKAGFEWVGPSAVLHGSRPWFEMRKTIAPPETQQVHPGILEALQRPPRNRPVPRLLPSFPNSISDVIVPDVDATPINKFDLLCPRAGCGSIILKAGAAKQVERTSVQLDPVGLSSHPLLPTLPPPPTTAQWWLVTPSPMIFENIGFSRPVQPQHSDTQGPRRLKLLTCADCDLGPLGWCEEGGSEFWLACGRVGYR